MALFSRKPQAAKIAEAYKAARELVNAVEGDSEKSAVVPNVKANSDGVFPYVPGQPFNVGPNGDLRGGQVTPLARPFDEFGNQMGPAYPLLPAAIDEVLDSTGRPLPRLYQYRIAENLDLTFENQPWNVLRGLVETCDLVHRACEVRIADITRMDTSWSLTDACINEIMAEKNITHSAAAKIGRERYADTLTMLEQTWENPYPEMHRGFDEWITEFMWNHLTYDGTPVYPRWKMNGKLLGFELLDPSTIKLLLNNRGARPLPPSPAYQQILWGFPRGEFVTDGEGTDDEQSSQGKFLYDGGKAQGVGPTDQLAYFKRNPRTWSPYGYSVVEECVPAATLWLERQQWLQAEYQAGSMPRGFAASPSEKIELKNIPAFSRIINDILSGKTGQRQEIQWVPQDTVFTFPAQIQEKYKADYDEFIIKRIAAIFGVSPQVLGVVARAGLGGGKGAQEGEAENSELVSQRPMTNFLVDMVNSLSRRFLPGVDKNVTFVFNDMDSGGPGDLIAAQAAQTQLFSGQTTLNNIQEAAGRPSYEMPEADEPFILGAGGQPLFLKGLMGKQQASADAAQALANNPPNQNGLPNGPQEGDNIQVQGNQGQGKPKNEVNDIDGKQTAKSVIEHDEFYNKSAEISAYKRYLRSGKTRPFNFNYLNDADLEEAGLAPRPKSLAKRSHPVIDQLHAIQANHAPQIFSALAIGGVGAAVAHALRMGPTEDATTAGAIASSAVLGNITFDQAAGAAVLQSIYQDATDVATQYAVGKFGPDAVLDQLPGMNDLLAQANITIKGITDTQMDQIATAIRDGLVNGSGLQTITANINDVLGDPARAQMIAETETNRGYATATMDTYTANGVAEYNYVAYDSACATCQDAEDDSPYQVGAGPQPPLHPNCECYTDAVTP
jgi:hypothetical protein